MLYALQKRLLWFKHSYKFRWAHDPLCERLGSGVLRIGPHADPWIYLCRSCLIVYSSAIVGGLVLFLGSVGPDAAAALFTALSLVALPLSFPAIYERLPRSVKDIARLSLGLAVATAPFAFLGRPFWAAAIVGVNLIAWRVFGKIRKTKKDQGCEGCPELRPNYICSGFEVQALGARGFEKQATVLFLASGRAPIPPNR